MYLSIAGGVRDLALLEARTEKLGELLADVMEQTVSMVEKKQARTYQEIERDLAAAVRNINLLISISLYTHVNL